MLSAQNYNCEDTIHYPNGKEWAYYTLDALKEPYFDKNGDTVYTHIRYLVCDNRYFTSLTCVDTVYEEFLSQDSIGIVSCTFDLGLGCKEEGMNFVYDSLLVANGYNERYFNKQLKQARRACKKRNR